MIQQFHFWLLNLKETKEVPNLPHSLQQYLLTTKMWKQSKTPLTNECKRKMWCETLSHKKKGCPHLQHDSEGTT